MYYFKPCISFAKMWENILLSNFRYQVSSNCIKRPHNFDSVIDTWPCWYLPGVPKKQCVSLGLGALVSWIIFKNNSFRLDIIHCVQKFSFIFFFYIYYSDMVKITSFNLIWIWVVRVLALVCMCFGHQKK